MYFISLFSCEELLFFAVSFLFALASPFMTKIRPSRSIKKWRFFAAIGLFLLGFHFFMVLIYVYKDQGVTNNFLYYNQKYMVPAFHQKWPLFAPDPANYDCQLKGRYWANNQWSKWLTTDKVRSEHYKIKHLEATLTSDFTKVIYSKKGMYQVDGKMRFDRLEKNFFYLETYYYMNQYFRKYYAVEPDSIQVRLDYTFPPDFFTGEIQDSIQLELNAIPTHE